KGAGGLHQLIEQQTGERIRFFLLRSQYRSTILFGEEGLEEAGQSLNAFYRLIGRFERLSGQAFYPRVNSVGEVEELAYAKTRSDGYALLAGVSDGLLEELSKLRASYLEKMDDDFNTGGAVSDLFEMSRAINRFIDQQHLEDTQRRTRAGLATLSTAMSVLRELGAIMGLFLKTPKKTGDDGASETVDGLMKLLIELRAKARAGKDFATSDAIRDGLAAMSITLQDLKEGTTWEKA
ncbi:MAG: cysteine--tRNA ligase, partial [Planctomycetales bacterium]|nr:cysteine--tRNA ligase [Planctomycetales bacterium]